MMGGSSNGNAIVGGSDTTFTKLFVGGLAWETQRDTMRRYFEQFGDIVEAVVITNKHTGRSKGYGFVTFLDPEGARRALQDRTPVIDGRRANCNLAALGAAQRVHPNAATPFGMVRFRPAMPSSSSSYHASAATTMASFFHQPAHYTYPYYYGYTGGYSQQNMHPMGYYGVYSGGGGSEQQQLQAQFPPYYTAGPAGVYQGLHHYYSQYMQAAGNQAQSSYAAAAQYPQLLQYSYVQQAQSGSRLAAPAPTSVQGGNAATTTTATSERRPMS